MKDEIQWSECPCHRCKRILRFKPQQAGNRVDCRFCKGNTLYSAPWGTVAKLLFVCALILGCDSQKTIEKRLENEAEAKWQVKVQELGYRTGAATNWLTQIPPKHLENVPFTIEVSRALIHTNGQPSLFV
jgi:hypothetical protein